MVGPNWTYVSVFSWLSEFGPAGLLSTNLKNVEEKKNQTLMLVERNFSKKKYFFKSLSWWRRRWVTVSIGCVRNGHRLLVDVVQTNSFERQKFIANMCSSSLLPHVCAERVRQIVTDDRSPLFENWEIVFPATLADSQTPCRGRQVWQSARFSSSWMVGCPREVTPFFALGFSSRLPNVCLVTCTQRMDEKLTTTTQRGTQQAGCQHVWLFSDSY